MVSMPRVPKMRRVREEDFDVTITPQSICLQSPALRASSVQSAGGDKDALQEWRERKNKYKIKNASPLIICFDPPLDRRLKPKGQTGSQ